MADLQNQVLAQQQVQAHITGRLTGQQLRGGSRAAAPSLGPPLSLGPLPQRRRRLLRGEGVQGLPVEGGEEGGPGATAALGASSSLPVMNRPADGAIASEGELGPLLYLPAALRGALEGRSWMHYAALFLGLYCAKNCVAHAVCGPKSEQNWRSRDVGDGGGYGGDGGGARGIGTGGDLPGGPRRR